MMQLCSCLFFFFYFAGCECTKMNLISGLCSSSMWCTYLLGPQSDLTQRKQRNKTRIEIYHWWNISASVKFPFNWVLVVTFPVSDHLNVRSCKVQSKKWHLLHRRNSRAVKLSAIAFWVSSSLLNLKSKTQRHISQRKEMNSVHIHKLYRSVSSYLTVAL